MSAAAVRSLSSVRVVETIATAAAGRRTLYRLDVWADDGVTVTPVLTLLVEGPLGRLRAVARLESLGYSLANFQRAEPAATCKHLHNSYAALRARLNRQGIL